MIDAKYFRPVNLAPYTLLIASFSLITVFTYAQVNPDRMGLELENEITGLEYYNHIVDMNEGGKEKSRSSTFTYQLDSLYSFHPKRQQNGDDYKGSVNYRYEKDFLNCISFHKICIGGITCELAGSTYNIYQYDTKDRILSRAGSLWDGENYIYDSNLQPHSVFIYKNDLLRSFTTTMVKDTLFYDAENLLIKVSKSVRVFPQDTLRLYEEYLEEILLDYTKRFFIHIMTMV